MVDKIENLFSEGTDVGAPSQQPAVSGAIISATDIADFESQIGRASQNGDEFYNTTTNLRQEYINGAWDDSVHAASTQTLTNKTLTSPTINGGSINNATLTDSTLSGTTTIINSTDLNVADAEIVINDGGNDATADGAGIRVERTGTDAKIKHDDALTSKFAVGVLGSEVEVVTTSQSQVLTGKDYDGGTASNTSRFTIPQDTKANLDALTRKKGTFVYATDEDVIYSDNGASLVEVGGGGGSGSGRKNYLTGDSVVFEGGVGSWLVSGNVTLASQSGVLLRGTNSALLNSTGSYTLGDYIYDAFTIDNTDQHSNLQVEFDYTTGSTVLDEDYEVILYDVTNAKEITSRLGLIKANTNGYFKAEFQTSPDSVSYQVRIKGKFASTTSGKQLYFENVLVTPDLVGGTGGSVGLGFSYIQSLPTQTTISTTFAASSNLIFSSGGKQHDYLSSYDDTTGEITIKESGMHFFYTSGDLSGTEASDDFAGTFIGVDTGSGFTENIRMFDRVYNSAMSSTQTMGYVGIDLNAGDKVAFRVVSGITGVALRSISKGHQIGGFKVGSSSGTSGGGDILQKVKANNVAAQTVATTQTKFLEYTTIEKDNKGSLLNIGSGNVLFSSPATAWGVEIQESGDYEIDTSVISNTSPGFTSGDVFELRVYIGTASSTGTLVAGNSKRPYTGQEFESAQISTTLEGLVKGDVVRVAVFSLGLTVGFLSSSAGYSSFSLNKLPETSNGIALEQVSYSAEYESNAGQSLDSGTDIIFEDIVRDTHNAYNASTGVFTAPFSDVFNFNLHVEWVLTGTSPSTGQFLAIREHLNGGGATNYLAAARVISASVTVYNMTATRIVKLEKDQTMKFSTQENTSATCNASTNNQLMRMTIDSKK